MNSIRLCHEKGGGRRKEPHLSVSREGELSLEVKVIGAGLRFVPVGVFQFKELFDGQAEDMRNLQSQNRGRIESSLLDGGDGLADHTCPLSEFLLGKPHTRSLYPDIILHDPTVCYQSTKIP